MISPSGFLPERLLRSSSHDLPEERLVFDTVDAADGLEHMIVVCVSLDAQIGGEDDLKTRAKLYKGITRAQLLAIVVNEHIRGGWLEFLGAVKFEHGHLRAEEASPQSSTAAAKINIEAQQRAPCESPGKQRLEVEPEAVAVEAVGAGSSSLMLVSFAFFPVLVTHKLSPGDEARGDRGGVRGAHEKAGGRSSQDRPKASRRS